MMWINDVLRLLNAKFKGRADRGYDCYVYTLPTGVEITVGPRERWWTPNSEGQGANDLFAATFPAVQLWEQEQKRITKDKADAEYAKVSGLIDRLIEHLKANDWGTIELSSNQAPYPALGVLIDGKTEVWLDFDEHGKIEYGSVVGTVITGTISLKKQLKRRYEFQC